MVCGTVAGRYFCLEGGRRVAFFLTLFWCVVYLFAYKVRGICLYRASLEEFLYLFRDLRTDPPPLFDWIGQIGY